MIDRRPTFVMTLLAGIAGVSCQGAPATDPVDLERQLAALELDGRLGVAVYDTADGSVTGYRLHERFAMCSTFKLPLAAMVLDRAARGTHTLNDRLEVADADLLGYSPVTKAAVEAVADGTVAKLTLARLAEAAQTRSDNAAANVLLRELGGPAAFTAFCRAHGDDHTRLDRFEPELNMVVPGDPRDTTTPAAMAALVAQLLDRVLAPADRELLRSWMLATKTGARRLRRGLPPSWPVGNKTGTGGGEAATVWCNDIAWIEPPGRAPLVVAVYYETGVIGGWPRAHDEAVLAEVARTVVRVMLADPGLLSSDQDPNPRPPRGRRLAGPCGSPG